MSMFVLLTDEGALTNFANFTGKHFCWMSPESLQLYQKETLTEVFSSEICEIFKNSYFEGHLWTTAAILREPENILRWKAVNVATKYNNMNFVKTQNVIEWK